MIPQRNLALLSNRLARDGGRCIPEAILERDYCLAWFLVGLSRTPLKERLSFKGGTALKRCYFGDYRFSEDLDFTLAAEVSFELIRKELDPVFAEVSRSSGVSMRFAREDTKSHQNSYTFYLSYEGPLPPTTRAKKVKVDVTISEEIVFPLESRRVLRAYTEFTTCPKIRRLTPIRSMKSPPKKWWHCSMRHGTNRDLYDLWYLTSYGHVDLDSLIDAIEMKWAFRKRRPTDVRRGSAAKEDRYKKLWEVRLAPQMAELPEFGEVSRLVRRALRDAGIVAR